MHAARQVIQLSDLPAVRFGDATRGPQQHLILAAELEHRLANPDELVRRAEIPAKQRDDPLPIPVQHRQALACPAHRKDPLAVLAPLNRTTVSQEPILAERRRVADRVDLKEILVIAAKPHHPASQLHRVSDTRITRHRMNLQQLTHKIADHAIGVIGMQDHLHDMPDRTLEQNDKIPRRARHRHHAQLLDDRPRRARPLRALAVTQEPARPQPPIDLHPQLRQIALHARSSQPHMPLNIIVTVRRGNHDLPQQLDRKITHDLAEIPPLNIASIRHPVILAPPPERCAHRRPDCRRRH